MVKARPNFSIDGSIEIRVLNTETATKSFLKRKMTFSSKPARRGRSSDDGNEQRRGGAVSRLRVEWRVHRQSQLRSTDVGPLEDDASRCYCIMASASLVRQGSTST